MFVSHASIVRGLGWSGVGCGVMMLCDDDYRQLGARAVKEM